ncbi:cilia- and flagella-associated protein 251-like isoform X2 [Scylla paramamosain]|uniref:cilia- and flagella-associated protein 251-like isoform X2 n=1 Tax=Scylla paramamosain TaxID=85552 RepID=UPI003082A68C
MGGGGGPHTPGLAVAWLISLLSSKSRGSTRTWWTQRLQKQREREREAREEGEEGEEEEREGGQEGGTSERERERKRLILLQQQLQQQQQLVSEEGEGPSSDAEDEVLFREAMSEVPVVGSPVPEYEVEEEKEEEDEEEARIRKKKRLLPVALPPADKGILRSPSYRFVRCKELAQEASEAV